MLMSTTSVSLDLFYQTIHETLGINSLEIWFILFNIHRLAQHVSEHQNFYSNLTLLVRSVKESMR